jgi:hypothetical protein
MHMKFVMQKMNRSFAPALAGVALIGSFSGLLSGCGGGSNNGGPGGNPTPAPTAAPARTPVVAPLPAVRPLTLAQLAPAVEARLPVQVQISSFDPAEPVPAPFRRNGAAVVKAQNRPDFVAPNEEAGINAILQRNAFVLPKFAEQTTGNQAAPALQSLSTVEQLGNDKTYLKQELDRANVVAAGDVLKKMEFTDERTGLVYTTVGVFRNNVLKFNSVTYATPGATQTSASTVGSNQAVTQKFNQNPFDGHYHYVYRLTVDFQYDSNGTALITKTTPAITEKGAFVRNLAAPTNPAPTSVRDNTQTPPWSERAESQVRFVFDYFGDTAGPNGATNARDDAWNHLVQLVVLVRDRVQTGGTGGRV